MTDAKPMVLTRPSFDATEIDNLQECLKSGWVTQGPFVSRFEKLVAQRQHLAERNIQRAQALMLLIASPTTGTNIG